MEDDVGYRGQTEFREIQRALPMLSARLRTAFAVAKRVSPVLVKFEPTVPVAKALELAWRHATGEPLDEVVVRNTLDELDDRLDEMRDRGDTDYVMTVLDAVYHTLVSVLPSQEYDAVGAAFDAAATAAAHGDRRNAESFVEQELAWQLLALSVVRACEGQSATREMFDSVASAPPWLADLLGD